MAAAQRPAWPARSCCTPVGLPVAGSFPGPRPGQRQTWEFCRPLKESVSWMTSRWLLVISEDLARAHVTYWLRHADITWTGDLGTWRDLPGVDAQSRTAKASKGDGADGEKVHGHVSGTVSAAPLEWSAGRAWLASLPATVWTQRQDGSRVSVPFEATGSH